jgi:hypothetical protein
MAFRDASRIPTLLLAISRLEHQVMRLDIPPWCVDRFESDSEPTTLTISPMAAGPRQFQPSRLHATVYTQVARSTRAWALNLVDLYSFWFLSKGFEPTCTESSPLIPLDSSGVLVHSNLIHSSNKNQPHSQSVRERRDRACGSCHSSSTICYAGYLFISGSVSGPSKHFLVPSPRLQATRTASSPLTPLDLPGYRCPRLFESN